MFPIVPDCKDVAAGSVSWPYYRGCQPLMPADSVMAWVTFFWNNR